MPRRTGRTALNVLRRLAQPAGRLAALLVPLLVPLTLGACASLGGIAVPEQGRYVDVVVPRTGPFPPPKAEYITLREVLQRTGVLEENAIATYARGVLDRVLAAWPGPRPTIALYITPDEGFYSEAAREGAILLTAGTFRYLAQTESVRTEDALAFILAHEAAHIILGHARDRQSTADMMHQIGGLVTLVGTVTAHTKFVQTARTAEKVVIGALLFTEATDGALFPGWGRSQEFQADALAVDLMAKAGYSAQVVPDVMRVLQVMEDRERASAAPPALFAQGGPNSFVIRPGAPLLNWMKELGRTHPPVGERDSAIRAYIERAWGDQVVAADTGRLRRAAATREVRQVLTESAAATQAYQELRQGQAASAMTRMRTVQANSPVGRSMVSRSTRALAAIELGDRSGSRQLDVVAEHPLATADVYRVRAVLAERAGALEEAAQIWKSSWDRFEDPSALPARIRLAKSLKRGMEATLLQAQCVSLGVTGMQELCAKAASGG